MLFINGYSIIVISDTSGYVHFISFSKREISYIDFHYVASINLAHESKSMFDYDDDPNKSPTFAIKLTLDAEYEDDDHMVSRCDLYAATNKGTVYRFNIMKLFTEPNDKIEFSEHSNKRINYNAERNADEDFLSIIYNNKITTLEIEESHYISSLDLVKEKNLKFFAHKDLITSL